MNKDKIFNVNAKLIILHIIFLDFIFEVRFFFNQLDQTTHLITIIMGRGA